MHLLNFFVSFLVDLNKFESLRNLTIFIILFISSSEIINNVEFWIAASIAEIAAVNPNSTKTL